MQRQPWPPRLRNARASASSSETHPQTELDASRFADSRDLSERRHWSSGIDTRAKSSVASHSVGAVGDVETLHQAFDGHATRETERSDDTRVQREEVVTGSRIPW